MMGIEENELRPCDQGTVIMNNTLHNYHSEYTWHTILDTAEYRQVHHVGRAIQIFPAVTGIYSHVSQMVQLNTFPILGILL